MKAESLLQTGKLSLEEIAAMSDNEATEAFKRMRWPDGICCPRCDCRDLYTMKATLEWKCKHCRHRFTMFSGTIFSSHKMPIRNYLMAIALFLHGHNALQMHKELGIQYRASHRLQKKIRSQLAGS